MKTINIFILLLSLTLGCKQKSKQNTIISKYDYILVNYSDSTYSKPLDSLYTNENDTIYFNKQFPIQGFFKIKNTDGTYSLGNLNKNKKTGKWKFYQNYLDKWLKYEEHNYNNEGKLDGEFIIYDINTQKPLSIHQYHNGEEVGIQKDYYPSGQLHIQYQTDNQGKFINTYTVYSPQGTELYKVNFGHKGTGYIKFYDKDNYVEWEGNFINKKKQGWHKDYITDYGSDKSEIVERKFYKDDSLISRTQIFLPWEKIPIPGYKQNKADSINYTSMDNQIKIKYYSEGKIITEELEK